MSKVTFHKEINGRMCVTTNFAAEILGVTPKTLAQWEKGGCPKAGRGYWDLKEVVNWRLEKFGAPESAKAENWPQRKIMWEAQLKEAQTTTQNIKNAILMGEYLRQADVEAELESFFVTLKQAVLRIPRSVGIHLAQIVGKEEARNIEKEVKENLHDVLSGWSGGNLLSGVDSKTPGKGAKGAGGNHSKRVGGPVQDP